MGDKNDKFCLDRRSFLKISGGTAAGLACTAAVPTIARAFSATSYEEIPILPGYTPRVSSAWIPKDQHEDAYDLFKQVVAQSTDFSWLSDGDSVMIKLALNSGLAFPATTDPWALKCMIRLLKEKGAGDIIVGDQSGTEYVVWTRFYKRGSSRKLCDGAGLLDVIDDEGVTPVFFEERGYDAYIGGYPPGDHHWDYPVYVTTALNEVDHLIYMPRVASHVICEITAGLKIAVGFLRADSRGRFHQGGDNIYAMYQEINDMDMIKSKLRLTVTSARKVLTTVGPDIGYITYPDHGLIFASDDLLAHDLLAFAWLQWNRKFKTPESDLAASYLITLHRSYINKGLLVLSCGVENLKWYTPCIPVYTAGNIYNHPANIDFMIRKGGRPQQILWDQVNQNPDNSVETYMDGLINPNAA